jgi:hypothetical protein
MEMGGITRKKGGSGKNKAKTYKIDRSEGGGSTSPGTIVQLTASSIPGKNGAPEPVGLNSRLTAAGAPLQIAGKRQATSATTSSKATASTAAATPVKVVLAAAKKKGRVILAAAKPTTQSSTRKVSHSKKVRMTISSLSRKIHKAKAIRKTATESSIEQIKKVLRSANLIKADSKAPEPMLRQMYADYMTLKGRAL